MGNRSDDRKRSNGRSGKDRRSEPNRRPPEKGARKRPREGREPNAARGEGPPAKRGKKPPVKGGKTPPAKGGKPPAYRRSPAEIREAAKGRQPGSPSPRGKPTAAPPNGPDGPGGPDRRTVLKGIAGMSVLGLGAASAGKFGSNKTYVIEQGDWCVPVQPLHTGEGVEDFYGYRKFQNPYDRRDGTARTSTNVERAGVSEAFLFENPSGDVCLVIIHDRYNADAGADPGVWFQFEGLPSFGKWILKDDPEDFSSIWSSPPHDVQWRWDEGETDGGVFCGGLNDDFEIVITPSSFGYVDDWWFLTGDPTNFDIVKLDMDRALTIRTGRCVKDGHHHEVPKNTITPNTPHEHPHDHFPRRTTHDHHGKDTGHRHPSDPPHDHPPDETETPPHQHFPDRPPETDLEVKKIKFKGCNEAWVVLEEVPSDPFSVHLKVFNAETGEIEVVQQTVHPEDLRHTGAFGGHPVYVFDVHAFFGRPADSPDAVLGIAVADGPFEENPNDCLPEKKTPKPKHKSKKKPKHRNKKKPKHKSKRKPKQHRNKRKPPKDGKPKHRNRKKPKHRNKRKSDGGHGGGWWPPWGGGGGRKDGWNWWNPWDGDDD